MSIVKIKKRKNFYVQIDKDSIEDKNLSFKATGLLVYLIGKPDDWKIILEHLKTCKTDGIDSVRSALLELRNNNYCHLFEIREKGVIKEKFYYIFETPTPFSEELLMKLKDDFKEFSEGVSLIYKPAKRKDIQPNFEKSIMEKSNMEKPIMNNPMLLKKEYTQEKLTNNKTTTNSKNDNKGKNRSSYEFLNFEKYSSLNNITKLNIQKNINNLKEKEFEEIYNLTFEYVKSGKGNNFNAILYKGLLGEWDFASVNSKAIQKELDEEKRKWLNYYSGIISDTALKEEVEKLIIDIPLEVLNKNKTKLGMMNSYDFKHCLYGLKKQSVSS